MGLNGSLHANEEVEVLKKEIKDSLKKLESMLDSEELIDCFQGYINHLMNVLIRLRRKNKKG